MQLAKPDPIVLLVEDPPLALEWVAVRDRLGRAAAGTAPDD